MIDNDALGRCLAFINCQLNPPPHQPASVPGTEKLAVTLSRETGAGALVIAQKLADYLQAHCPARCAWAVFDRNITEKVLEEHHLPTRMAKFLPEDSISTVDDIIEELFGLHPPSWVVVRQTAETILHLAELGHVIVVGRGANVITSKLPHVFHVRLVGSLEKRLARLQPHLKLSRKAALEFIRKSDRGRVRYLRKYFKKDIDDPLLYDLVVNTDRFSEDEVVRLIGSTVLMRSRARKGETTDEQR